jgi:hypothetical protein
VRRCIHCHENVDEFREGANHGPGICVDTGKQFVTATDDPEVFRLHEGNGQTPYVTMTRAEVEHLAKIMAGALGWAVGPDLRLNPSNLPTRAELFDAVSRARVDIPDEPELNRATTSLAILKEYCAWLPDIHRMRAEADLQFIARRMEELVSCYSMLRKFRQLFSGRPADTSGMQDMFAFINAFVNELKERTGVVLWE